MAIYDKFADAPNRLKLEGQEITVKLVRNGDGTATIKWNIPVISGCDVENLVYDGIVITVSNRPANHITTSPQSGTYYDADATFDRDLHTGDSINVASVVGAFYHDKSTVSLTVNDVLEKTPYYVSAYAVDQNGNYHREGVHAYSLPTSQAETQQAGDETPAYHDVLVDTPEGISTKARTGLVIGTTYNIKLLINGKCYEYDDLLGSDVQTFEDLASTINNRLIMSTNPILGPLFPNEGKYMVDVDNETVYMWDGSANIEQVSTFFGTDPSIPILDTYWYKPSTDALKVREVGGWASVTSIIKYSSDPSMPVDGTVWLDKAFNSNNELDTLNTSGWVWDGVTWCKKPTIIQTRSPLLPPVLTSSDYWYNEEDGSVSKRNIELRTWEEVNPVVWDTDPNTIADANHWYNQETELALIRVSGVWEEINNIRYAERNSVGELDSPVANHYWLIPSEQVLLKRDATNTVWVDVNVVISYNDPADRASCDAWWDVSVGVDNLFIWDAVNITWVAVTNFTQSAVDPATTVTLEAGTLWYNQETEVMQKITGLNCSDIQYICSSYDPTNLPVGIVWLKTTDNTWYIWDGSAFVLITVIVDEDDPYVVVDGMFWYNTASDELYLRVVGVWVLQVYTTDTLSPAIGTLFYDTLEDALLEWDGEAWIAACGLAEVVLDFNRSVCFDNMTNSISSSLFSPYNDIDKFGRDLIRFKTCNTGCDETIIVDEMSSVMSSLSKPVMYQNPATGRSINEAGSTYRELGVGDDGTPDERRKLQDQIRVALGSVGVQVELTKQQLDECIDNALLMVRKYSSYSYQHVMFFMDVVPNQQRYLLTNKCVGFNKISNINAAYRMKGGGLGLGRGGGMGGGDLHGYAAMQQLYHAGKFDMLSFHLVSQYIEELNMIFANNIVFDFYEDTRILNFHQVFYHKERILLDAFIDLPEQKLMTNRYLELWIKKWALAEAKMILSQVRGKFQSLPGPNGSTVLNSQELITQAENEKVELREELHDRSMQDHNSDVQSQFFMG
jgi:hypothetical protein